MNRNISIKEAPTAASFPPAREGDRGGNLFHATLVAVFLICLLGCGTASVITRDNVIARAGSRELTREDFERLAGAPLGSVTGPERWTIINNWIQNAAVEQEGKRRGLDKDPEIAAQMDRVRSELYLARILKDDRMEEIPEEVIETYFADHADEFMQTEDGYLIELYFAKDCERLNEFIAGYRDGDLDLPDDGSVRQEQRWLAQTSEMNDYLGIVLNNLSPDNWTEVRADGEGCRAIHLVSIWPAGTKLDLDAARGEIEMQLRIDKTHRQREDFLSELRARYPATIFLEDTP